MISCGTLILVCVLTEQLLLIKQCLQFQGVDFFLFMVYLSFALCWLTILLMSHCLSALDPIDQTVLWICLDLKEDKHFSVFGLRLEENEEPLIKNQCCELRRSDLIEVLRKEREMHDRADGQENIQTELNIFSSSEWTQRQYLKPLQTLSAQWYLIQAKRKSSAAEAH